jgi:AbrB family looped-hinge helix DNA binding protein
MEKPVIFGKKGRTTIPLPLRRKLGWQAGDTLRFHLDGDRVVISREVSHKRPSREHPAVMLAAELPALAQLLAQLAPMVFGGADDG